MEPGSFEWPGVDKILRKEAKRIIAMGPSGAAEAERFFKQTLEACDKDQMLCALDVIEATGAQSRVLERFKKLAPKDQTKEFFRSLWDVHGGTLREKMDNDTVLCDVLRKLFQPYEGPEMKLYRGEIAAQYD